VTLPATAVMAPLELLLAIALAGCSRPAPPSQDVILPLGSFGEDSLPLVEVELAGRRVSFILDFGAGPTVVSKQLCDSLRCESAGRMAGVRHTGELLELPLVTVPSLQVGPIRHADFVVAAMDLSPWQQVAPIAGVLSLQPLEHAHFTLDLARHELAVGRGSIVRTTSADSARNRVALIREHPYALMLALPVFLGGRSVGWGLVDTGSPQTYLHANWKDAVAQHGRPLEARAERGWTGLRESVKYWAVRGLAVLDDRIAVDSMSVGVKRMVPDALIGLDWLRIHVLSCDLDARSCTVRQAR
jgi:hypothetical protein